MSRTCTRWACTGSYTESLVVSQEVEQQSNATYEPAAQLQLELPQCWLTGAEVA